MFIDDEEKDLSEDQKEEQTSNESEEGTKDKTYTQDEVNKLLEENDKKHDEIFNTKFDRRWGSNMDKINRENAKRDSLIEMYMQKTNSKDIDELISLSEEQYETKIVNKQDIKDMERLGKLDAKDILELDDNLVSLEVERLSKLEKRNAREESTFNELNNYVKEKEKEKNLIEEFEKAGIEKETYDSKEFREFFDKYKGQASAEDVFSLYNKINNKEKNRPFNAGSAKGESSSAGEIKEFYTYEESKQFTKSDFDKNPKLFERVKASMPRWYKK